MNKIQIIHFEDVTDIEAVETVAKLLNLHVTLNDGDGYRFGDLEVDYGEVNTYGDESPVYQVYRATK